MTKNSEMSEQFQGVLIGAVESALWSSYPSVPEDKEGDLAEPADTYKIAEEEMTKLRGTLAYFIRDWFLENYPLLQKANKKLGWDIIGHDFWLTSQGHGAGFWDRGLGELGDDLTDSVSGHSDLVGFYLNDELTHVLIDPYNVQDFSDDLLLT